VLNRFAVGEYQIVILGADDALGLDQWLRDHGYRIPAGAEPFLRPYVQAGMKFFVARVDPGSRVRPARGGRSRRAPRGPPARDRRALEGRSGGPSRGDRAGAGPRRLRRVPRRERPRGRARGGLRLRPGGAVGAAAQAARYVAEVTGRPEP
jgi:hypothetical protein